MEPYWLAGETYCLHYTMPSLLLDQCEMQDKEKNSRGNAYNPWQENKR
jgi:hypothetical protein